MNCCQTGQIRIVWHNLSLFLDGLDRLHGGHVLVEDEVGDDAACRPGQKVIFTSVNLNRTIQKWQLSTLFSCVVQASLVVFTMWLPMKLIHHGGILKTAIRSSIKVKHLGTS